MGGYQKSFKVIFAFFFFSNAVSTDEHNNMALESTIWQRIAQL